MNQELKRHLYCFRVFLARSDGTSDFRGQTQVNYISSFTSYKLFISSKFRKVEIINFQASIFEDSSIVEKKVYSPFIFVGVVEPINKEWHSLHTNRTILDYNWLHISNWIIISIMIPISNMCIDPWFISVECSTLCHLNYNDDILINRLNNEMQNILI